MEVLKVSSKSNPNSVAGAMAGVVRQAGAVEVQVVGAGALNQAIKAMAIARGYVAPSGIDLVCVPTFHDIQIDGESRTAIRLLVESRSAMSPAAATPSAGSSSALSAAATSQLASGPATVDLRGGHGDRSGPERTGRAWT
jgi:stage V sporulation protein S